MRRVFASTLILFSSAAAVVAGCGSSDTGTGYVVPGFDAGLGGPDGGSSGSGTGTGPGSSSGTGTGTGPSSGSGSGSASGSGSGSGSGTGSGSGSSPVDAGPTGAAITCANPGTYKMNGGSCGTERWDIKTGTDPYTGMVSLVPKPNTIAALTALPAAGAGTMRESPTETTLWELKDVTLTEIKLESDSDEHLVLSDGTNTMLAEVPYPSCASASPWLCFITHVRSEIDAKYTVSSSPQYPAATVTVRGVGFFDFKHGQTGVAPNAIELHPVLQICFGQGCTPS